MPVMDTPDGVEVTRRVNEKGVFVFLLNHRDDDYTAVLPFGGTNLLDGKNYKTGDTLILAGKDAAIVKLQ